MKWNEKNVSVNTFILHFRFVMSLVSFIQNTLLAFISLRHPKWWVASHFILFYYGDFRFCVCLRAFVCAWVQSLDWDHSRIKHQFSVCAFSFYQHCWLCSLTFSAKPSSLRLAASHHCSALPTSPALPKFQSFMFLQVTNSCPQQPQGFAKI